MIINNLKIGGSVVGPCANFSEFQNVANRIFSKSFRNFLKIQTTPPDNVARKACTKFHETTTIRNDFKIRGTMTGPRANISKSKNVENHMFLEKF